MGKILEDKVFLKAMLTLAIPIALQNLITTSLNLVDNLMIGKLGETPIAAVYIYFMYNGYKCRSQYIYGSVLG